MSNKTQAVALKYHAKQDHAPMIVATGHGIIAQNMIDIAEKANIPVYRDENLANVLCMLKVGQSIPTELYEVIATIYVALMTIVAEQSKSEF